jgi:PAS domain S-box-containing protein
MNELYRFVTEVTNDCLWEWTFKNKEFFWIDGGHKRVFGYDVVNATISQSFWESCIHPDDRVRVLAKLNDVIKEKNSNVWEDEYRFLRANGEYAFVHDKGHLIEGVDKGYSRMIGATRDITSRISAENKLIEERSSHQKKITDAVLTAQENERASIGKELHDNLSQILSVTKMYVQMAKMSEKNREGYLDKASGFIMDVIEDIRKISKALIIPEVNVIGLFDNIRVLLSDIELIRPIKITFNTNGINEIELNEKLKINIFRIIQEQLNNIMKHSIASIANIKLAIQDNKIILFISDNGLGCDLSKEINGVGIINIKARAELLGGDVSIVSELGGGYKLNVTLPFINNELPINPPA